MKDLLLEYERRGFGRVEEKYLCKDCFSEEYWQNWVKLNAVKKTKCSYCGEISHCVTLEQFLYKFRDGLLTYYSRACDEGMYPDSEDGKYFVQTWDTYDLIGDELIGEIGFESEELEYDVKQALDGPVWCKKDPLGMNHGEREEYSWEHFCELVKYKTRYCFFTEMSDEYGETLAPVDILNFITNKIENLNIIKTLPKGSKMYRVRVFKKRKDKVLNVKNLGSPSAECASNGRMNAYGISVFYASETIETAIKEACDESSKNIVGSVFVNLSELKYLDLTQLKNMKVPNMFDTDKKEERQTILFLKYLHRALTRNVAPKKGIAKEIEYVPTQIFAEYVRYALGLDGIRYNSAKDFNGVCVVLFFNQKQCLDETSSLPFNLGEQKLKLIDVIDYKRKDEIRDVLKKGS